MSQIDYKQETDYVPPLRFTHAQHRRPDYVPLHVPTRTIPQQMSLTSVVTKTSIREELKRGAEYMVADVWGEHR